MEFSKYTERGAYHWQKIYGSVFKYSPRLDARYNLAISCVKRHKDINKAVGIDIGSGDGVLLYKVRKNGGKIFGLDNSKPGVELARSELAKRNVPSDDILESSCYEIPLEDNSLDYVIAVEIIEHLDQVDTFLGEIRRMLKPGGVLVCSTPNRKEGQGYDEVTDPFHVHEYVTDEYETLFKSKFSKVEVLGAFPDALDKKYMSLSGVGVLDKAFRALFKCYSKYVSNPYMSALKEKPGLDYRQLIALCVK